MALRFGFNFWHHGKYSSFHRMLGFIDEADDFLDATPSMIRRLPYPLAKRLEWYSLRSSERKAWQMARRLEQKVFHYLYPENTCYRGRLWKRDEKVIVSCHQPQDYLERYFESPGLAKLRNALELADGVAVLGIEEVDLYRKLAPHAKVEFIPHGIDTDWFHPVEGETSDRCSYPVVLTIGSWLRDYKVWADVVEAWAHSASEIRFRVLADTSTIKKAMSGLSPAAKKLVEPLSKISDEELRALYWTSDVLFLPLTAAMANNTILEAMATGLPIVTTDLAGTRSYAEDGAEYFPAKDPNPALAALQKIVADTPSQGILAAKALEQVTNRLSWPSVVKQYQSLAEKI